MMAQHPTNLTAEKLIRIYRQRIEQGIAGPRLTPLPEAIAPPDDLEMIEPAAPAVRPARVTNPLKERSKPMKRKLTNEEAKIAYEQLYIGQSQNATYCAAELGVSLATIGTRWSKLKLDLRTPAQEKQAAKQRGQPWQWPVVEAAPAIEGVGEPADPLEAIPTLEVGDSVAFKIKDGEVIEVEHRPAAQGDPADKETYLVQENGQLAGVSESRPGQRAIKADEFDELLDKIKGQTPATITASANGHAHIISVVNLEVTDKTYFHPIIGDIDRLFGRLCARGIPAHKAVKHALRAAELARLGVEPSAKIG